LAFGFFRKSGAAFLQSLVSKTKLCLLWKRHYMKLRFATRTQPFGIWIALQNELLFFFVTVCTNAMRRISVVRGWIEQIYKNPFANAVKVVTPAMAAGLVDHQMTFSEMLLTPD
jgi:hypothetical protein